MSDSAAVPLIVVSASRDPVESVNALLRRQGVAAHCTWVSALNDLPESLEQVRPQLLLCVVDEHVEVGGVAGAVRGADVPLLAVRGAITEDLLLVDLVAGARDSINLAQPDRAHRVIARELHNWRLQRAYGEASNAARNSRQQLDSVLTLSNDAIIDVQEGILVEANQAWLAMVQSEAAAVVGEPVMDVFHPDSHVALKGALTACLRGQWKDHVLKANARGGADGSARVAVELLLTLGEREGEPCVRIMVPVRATETAQAATAAATGKVPTLAPARAPEGAMASVAKASAAAPATANTTPAAAAPAPAAAAATAVSAETKPTEQDAIWVRHVQAALSENRFRLVQQPITNLGGGPTMYDLLVRMLDRNRKEILPGEFLPAAERNNLMGPIDRWVIGAAARFAAESKPGCLFVRLSRQSALDTVLPRWLTAQLGAAGVDPQMLCLTVTEAVAAAHLDAVRSQARAIKALGLRFALERFGTGPDPLGLLGAVPMDFVKIDGDLIQGVHGDSLVQSKVEALVEAARERNVETIAANVEDANTMAVLWQLGVQHLEGFLIQAPEEVVLS